MTLNSRPLSYVSSEDVEEPLTPSHLLCGYRVLSLPDLMSNEDENNYGASVTSGDLTRRMKHLSKTLNDFWRRWRTEYLLELREAHRHLRDPKGVDDPIAAGDVVVVHDENLPRGLWKLSKVEKLIPGTDGNVRCAVVKVASKGQHSVTLKRPVQRLYPLEFKGQEVSSSMTEAQARLPLTEDDSPPALPPPEPIVESTEPLARAVQ